MLVRFVLLGAIAVVFAAACGQDVATCDSVCAGAPQASCSTACQSEQTACGEAGLSGAFQDYLTCISNAGGLVQGNNPTICSAEVTAVAGCEEPGVTR